MKKRDNEFIGQILDLADEHFSQELNAAKLQTTVTEKWAEAELDARASGEPFNLENVRWAIRRILFQPDVWPGVDPQQSAVRRTALEKALLLCKN